MKALYVSRSQIAGASEPSDCRPLPAPQSTHHADTHGALEITAIRNIDNGQARLIVAAGAGLAAPTDLNSRSMRGIQKDQLIPLFQFPVQIRIREDQGLGRIMAAALRPLIYLAISIDDFCRNRFATLWAQRRDSIDDGIADMSVHRMPLIIKCGSKKYTRRQGFCGLNQNLAFS